MEKKDWAKGDSRVAEGGAEAEEEDDDGRPSPVPCTVSACSFSLRMCSAVGGRGFAE